MKETYIGIDIGTTSIKLAAMDKAMNVVYDVAYVYEYLTPHKDWTEIHPDTWYEIVLKGLSEIFQHIDTENIVGMGITGQMHTTVFVDKHGRSVRPAIMWNDARTKENIASIKEKLGVLPNTRPITKIISTGSPLANLLWVKEHEPHHFQKIAKVLITKDYLVWKLTGVYSTDYCDASTSSFYDFYHNQWSHEVQELFDLDEKLFPKINYSSKIVGYLQMDLSEKFGLTKKLPVVAGTGDNVASALAAGCFEENQPLISLGTSGVVVIPNGEHQLKERGKNVVVGIQENSHAIMTQGTVQAGAKVNSWWVEKIIQTNNFTAEQHKIPVELLGKNDVLFFPHLSGEKTLYARPDLRGAFVGLSLETTREALYLAVLEGLAFGIRQLFDQMKNKEKPQYFTIVGGGAKSDLWVQLFANILNTPMRHVQSAQGAVNGAVALAIIGVKGQWQLMPSEIEWVSPSTTIAKNYEQKYQEYLELVKAMIQYAAKEN